MHSSRPYIYFTGISICNTLNCYISYIINPHKLSAPRLADSADERQMHLVFASTNEIIFVPEAYNRPE